MISESFWESVPPLDIVDYVKNVKADSPVARSVKGRDCEIQALSELWLLLSGAELERFEEVGKSRATTRQKFFGEWSDDNSPFTEEEVATLRSQIKPWDFSDGVLEQLDRIYAE